MADLGYMMLLRAAVAAKRELEQKRYVDSDFGSLIGLARLIDSGTLASRQSMDVATRHFEFLFRGGRVQSTAEEAWADRWLEGM